MLLIWIRLNKLKASDGINSTDESIPVGGGGGTSPLAESRMVAFQSTDMADASEPSSMSH